MELISIVDCDLCVALPPDQHVPESELPLPDTWGRLLTILVRRDWNDHWSADLARYAASLNIEEIRVCRACGTHYHYRQDHDSHFGEPRLPETDWYLRRLAPSDARAYYIEQISPTGAVEHLDGGWLAQRYATIIGLLRRDFQRAPDLLIKEYMVESLYLHYVNDQDWEGLRATLLDCPDPAVGVYVARRIFETTDPKHPGRGLAPSSMKYWDNVDAIRWAEPTREPLLIAVLARGLLAEGQIMKLFLYPTRWKPVSLASVAMETLQAYVPRQSLAPAIPALAEALQRPGSAGGWQGVARDLLIEYGGSGPESERNS